MPSKRKDVEILHVDEWKAKHAKTLSDTSKERAAVGRLAARSARSPSTPRWTPNSAREAWTEKLATGHFRYKFRDISKPMQPLPNGYGFPQIVVPTRAADIQVQGYKGIAISTCYCRADYVLERREDDVFEDAYGKLLHLFWILPFDDPFGWGYKGGYKKRY